MLLILTVTSGASGWGGATHVQLASDLLGQLWLLPASIGGLILRNRWSYLYGNVAADVVLAKKWSRVRQVCHHWTTGFAILRAARTDEERAFGHGYLSHLAADTVAHNKFLPRQFALSRTTLNFGHLYWEMRADSQVSSAAWQRLRATLGRSYPGPRQLLESHLQSTLLPFRANQRVFNRMNMIASLKSWRKSVGYWARYSRWPLSGDVVAQYRAESLARMVDVLSRGEASTVLHDDPNGNAALALAKAQRRQIRQMLRAGIAIEPVMAETAAAHAPQLGRGAVMSLQRE